MAHAVLETAAPLVPERPTLDKLRAAAAGCTACPLYRTGTQTVFGEGLSEARAICLGATAAQALLGKSFKVTQMRGEILQHELVRAIMATVHPSSILRAPDEETRHREMDLLIRDLRHIAPLLQH